MKLATQKQIKEIDAFCIEKLDIPMTVLMKSAGEAVAARVRLNAKPGAKVLILSGKGNNGGDGYAAACSLFREYEVYVCDVFSQGQRSDAGKHFLSEFMKLSGKVLFPKSMEEIFRLIKSCDVLVDAIFGTGFSGEIPPELEALAKIINESDAPYKIAVDIPLGVNADTGSVSRNAVRVDETLELSMIKPGVLSYPARSYVGKITLDTIGVPIERILTEFEFKNNMIDSQFLVSELPLRERNSNKGFFGKLLMITGSEKYRGAAHLTLEAALRSGVGYVNFFGERRLNKELRMKFPEAVYKKIRRTEKIKSSDIEKILSCSQKSSAILVGSGSSKSGGLFRLVKALSEKEGAPLVLDADAINALAGEGDVGLCVLKNAKRQLILTPHPLEFSRISGHSVESIANNRLELAKSFAKETGVTLVLKGAGSIVTDGDECYINTLGSSSLAKAGSGDVLAGLVASFVAEGLNPLKAASLAVGFHALAADKLDIEFSEFGVTPSDLPKEIARAIRESEKQK